MRDLNRNFLLPIAAMIPQSRELAKETHLPVLPARQEGAQTGNGFVVCATCHQGIIKPMNGANMVNDYPGLVEPPAPAPHAAAAAPAPG